MHQVGGAHSREAAGQPCEAAVCQRGRWWDHFLLHKLVSECGVMQGGGQWCGHDRRLAGQRSQGLRGAARGGSCCQSSTQAGERRSSRHHHFWQGLHSSSPLLPTLALPFLRASGSLPQGASVMSRIPREPSQSIASCCPCVRQKFSKLPCRAVVNYVPVPPICRCVGNRIPINSDIVVVEYAVRQAPTFAVRPKQLQQLCCTGGGCSVGWGLQSRQ